MPGDHEQLGAIHPDSGTWVTFFSPPIKNNKKVNNIVSF